MLLKLYSAVKNCKLKDYDAVQQPSNPTAHDSTSNYCNVTKKHYPQLHWFTAVLPSFTWLVTR